MSERSRIVITGMGAVTPVGIGVETYWKNLIAGVCGIGPLTLLDSSRLPVQIGGEVRNFDPTQFMPRNQVNKMARFTQLAYAAAEEALADSGLEIDPYRTGLVMGTAMNGIAEICQTQEQYGRTGRKVSPRFVPMVLGNMAACQIAMPHNIQGPSFTVGTACASGIDAITMAVTLLRAGSADAMLAVGGDSGICAPVISSLSTSNALSRNNGDPLHASCPFDRKRDGFVMGEGGGALMLETEAHALARGAKIYGEVLGCANNNDAYHITSPRPHGEGGGLCMQLALKDAGIRPEEVGYVNAHGTSTPVGDVLECDAIRTVFDDHAAQLPVSSTKGATGHMMGAGGVTEVIACVLGIRDGILPPTLNVTDLDPACGLDCVPLAARRKEYDIAMSNAFGFGGQNASIVVGRYRP